MEYMAFKECMKYLDTKEVTVDTLITDRHSSISKHMRTSKKCEALL